MKLGANNLDIDWCDRNAVIALAKKCGKGNVVIKYNDRDNYTITHTDRAYRLIKYSKAVLEFIVS